MTPEGGRSLAGTATLLDSLSPIIARTFAIQPTIAQVVRDPKAATRIHNELFNRLRVVRDEARASGKSDVDIYHGIFAVAAWIDETLGREEGWKGRAPPLTATLFKSADPSREFFTRLDELTRAQSEVREVFYVVLGLGFSGGAQSDGNRAAELRRLKARHAGQLDPPPISPDSLAEEPITPQPYRVADPPPAPPLTARRRPVTTVILAVMLLTALAAAVWWWSAEPQPSAEFAGPEADRLRGVIDLVASGYPCARIAVALREDRVIDLSGYVSSENDRRRLIDSLASIEGVAGVAASVLVYQRPFCEIIGILTEHASVAPGRPGMPALLPDQPELRYAIGDDLIVQAVASSRFRGYLYVDLIDGEGTVTHLLPEPLTPDNLLDAGEQVTLGTAPDRARLNDRRWTLDRPAGTRMLMAISTPVPLFEDFRPLHESADSYFPALLDSLRSLAGLGRETALPATYLFLDVRAADPAAAGQQN